MYEIWVLGLLIGLQHALEADHLMAMATLASDGGTVRAIARRGMAWGIGHTATLLALGGTALLLGTLVPPQLATLLESAVGAMLVLLGADVLRRLHSKRMRLDPHGPGDSCVAPSAAHVHAFAQASAFPLRALGVGMMHGMAGSAALVLLTVHSVRSPAEGLAYILVFGAGSIIGMGLLGAVIGLPLGWSARAWAGAARALNTLIGCATTGLGLWVMYSAACLALPG